MLIRNERDPPVRRVSPPDILEPTTALEVTSMTDKTITLPHRMTKSATIRGSQSHAIHLAQNPLVNHTQCS